MKDFFLFNSTALPHDRRGFALLWLLVILSFLGLLLLIATQSIHRRAQRLVVQKRQAVLTVGARNNLSEALFMFETRPYPLHPFTPNISELHSSTQDHELFAGRKLSLLIMRPYTFGFAYPDWEVLQQLSSGNAAACRSWEENSLKSFERTNMRSSRSCRGLESVRHSFYLPGNLAIEHLEIAGVQDRRLNIAIGGMLQLEDGIEIRETHNATISLFVLGSAQVGEITSSNTSNSHLLVHSSTGSLTVSPSNVLEDTCLGANTGVSLRLEAAGKLLIAEAPQAKNVFGCAFAKNPSFWPPYRIIGEAALRAEVVKNSR